MARPPLETDLLFVPAGAVRAGLPGQIRLSPSRRFPPATASTPEGLVCVGGRLSPEWLLDAYSHGIFPWPMWDDEPMAWWSLDPRAIIEMDGLHVSRRLRRKMQSGKFAVTCNRAFDEVIRACAVGPGREEGTWLTPAMIDAYCELHRLGHAHSVEVWLAEGESHSLVGGIYGVAIGGLFAAESMFHRAPDASKVALANLVAHLRSRGYQLLDIQQWTSHTGNLGAIEISRLEYLRRLGEALPKPVTFGERLEVLE
jgi:leucyl/phenylalanyl-tRNA---protein transferase